MIKYCNVTKAFKKCKYISSPSSACFAPDGYVCKLEKEDLKNAEKWFAEQRKRAKEFYSSNSYEQEQIIEKED